MHTPRPTNSCLVITSPKKRKAIIAAKIGEVLLRKANFDNEINLIAILKIKKVRVPDIALMITNLH
jgi:hypothetical protein